MEFPITIRHRNMNSDDLDHEPLRRSGKTMRLRNVIPIIICLAGALAGCGLGEQDPSKLPNYKDVTEPANMPSMPQKPGAAAPGAPGGAAPGVPAPGVPAPGGS
jgi:hypothetical protein